VVERKDAATAAWVTIATTAANAVCYSDTSGLAGQTYYYQVSAYNASGKSASSNTATVTIGPLAPSNLVATPITGTVSLTWKDNSTDETGFIVERKDLAAKTGWATIGTPAANTVVYTDTFGLSSGQLYYYQVRASNGTGNSAPSNQVSVVTPGGCPVTSAADSGLNTLRAALSNATCTSITFPSPITITITSPTPELKVSPSVKILGICSATGPGVVIKGTGVTGSGLTLGGKNTIFGVKISGFTGPGPLLLDTTLGNQLACVNTTR
jgi:hypothetical protein